MKRIICIFYVIFCFHLFSEIKPVLIDFNVVKLPASADVKGGVVIGEIKNKRVSDMTDDRFVTDPCFVGNIRNGYGVAFPLFLLKSDSLENKFRNVLTNALQVSGYTVSDSLNSKSPSIGIDITNFYFDGYMGYGLSIEYDLVIKSPEGDLLFKKTFIKKSSILISGSYYELFNTYSSALNDMLFQMATFFGSQKFETVYKNMVSAGSEQCPYIKKKLKEVPADIENKDSVEFMDLYKNDIKKIENLDKYPNLLFVNLQENKITKMENLGLSRIKGLNFSDNPIAKIQNLDGLPELSFLIFDSNKFGKMEKLDGLTNLLWLNITNQPGIMKIAGLDNLAKLAILEIVKCKNIDTLENLGKLTGLYSLTISLTDIDKIQKLDGLTDLRELNLAGNSIEKIENLDKLVNLEYLNLSENKFSKIQNLDKLTNLKKLVISGKMMSDSLSKIENLDSLSELEYLDLSVNSIKKIDNLKSLTKLKVLNLGLNPITKIENLENLISLKSVIFNNGMMQPLSDKQPVKISRSCHKFLKENNVLINELYDVDEYVAKYNIKIE
jgi:Leucine-rich repeat (LRR) protein